MTELYDVRQFRPALFVAIAMGFAGYAISFSAGPAWLVCTLALAINAYLVRHDRFTPLSRRLAGLITVLALMYAASGIRPQQGLDKSIDAVAMFLMMLQVVKLYEIRGNRDYAQLLVLSLLLMVAAAIATALLAFGILLIIYLFVSLYCCLLFHLKVEADNARTILSPPRQRFNPATLRHDQRFMAASMRRVTGLVAVVAISSAIVVFVFCPRPSGPGFLATMAQPPDPVMTGFSNRVTLGGLNRISENTAEVASVRVWKNDRLVEGTETLYLRGATFEYYQRDANAVGRWGWTPRRMPALEPVPGGEPFYLRKELANATPAEKWHQRIILLPTTEASPLFSLAGAYRIQFKDDQQIAYSQRDGITRLGAQILDRLEYEVDSDNRLERYRPPSVWWSNSPRGDDPPPSRIDPYIASLAEQVCGSDAEGPLARRRDRGRGPTELDARIALDIETYLKTNFAYTLDLSDEDPMEGKDPVVRFLQDHKKGHCEYFASAMTLMCQSLGMRARLVTGFRCGGDSYDPLGRYYLVQQLHAHAWVEVLTPDGWRRFDPTSGRMAPAVPPTLWRKARHFFNRLQYKWQSGVIAYGADERDNLMGRLNNSLTNLLSSSVASWADLRAWIAGVDAWNAWYKMLAGLVGVIVFIGLAAVSWFIAERWRLRRKALAIGLHALPPAEQLRLARQLGFYADLLVLLEQRGLTKPPRLTPMEFAESLSTLPQSVHAAVLRLTRLFYQVRFGHLAIPSRHHRRLQASLAKIAASVPLAAAPPSDRTA